MRAPVVIREDRGADFWTAIASHPEVRPTLLGLEPRAVGVLAGRPEVLPLASENGGFLFTQLDALGFVRDLHTLFTPAGWGREAFTAGVAALGVVFETAQVLTTLQVGENPRSQPPVSFGFTPAGDWAGTPIGMVRPWILTRACWLKSPGAKRCRSPSLEA